MRERSFLRFALILNRVETRASSLCRTSQVKMGESPSSQGEGSEEILSRMRVRISESWLRAICGSVSWRAASS